LKQPADIKTGSGDVAIHTDKRPESMRVIFTSGSGDLHSEWKEAAESTDNDGNRNVVFGRGETLLSVDTGSGGLSIRQR
jgi:hypothetical protein